jgi:Intracellular proteinase inhibitor
MPSRLVPVLVMAAAVVFACGPRSHSAETVARKTVSGPSIASSLDVQVGEQIAFAFHVTNNADKRLELNFPSGQTHDIVVLDSVGRELWRWSEGRMFTQALQNRVLEERETVSYEARWEPERHHGTFEAVAMLRSGNHPLERRVQFTLP